MTRLRQSAVSLPVLLGLFVFCLYLFTASSDLLHNGDTDLRYQTTQAIVDHQRLWIAQPMYTDTRVAAGLGGHLYAFYAPGQAVLMVPLYIAGKAVAHHLGLPYDITTLYAARSLDLILGALLAVAVYVFALVIGYGRGVAVVLGLLFALATAAWPDAQSALDQTQVNLFLLLGSLFLWLGVRSGARLGYLALSACACGAALLTRYDAGIYAIVFAGFAALYLARTHGARATVRALAGFGAALTPWLVLLGLWNEARFGSPFLTGLHEQTFGGSFVSGLLGLSVSPGKGLIWYVPIIFLLPWAAGSFVRRRPELAVLFGALVLMPLLFYANVEYWHGDPAWGPRYIFTVIPYLVLPLGEIFARWSAVAPPLKIWAVAIIAISFGLQVAAVSVTQWRFWYRLEALQEQTTNASTWTGQPFRWGAAHYHYYWNVRESPVWIQIDDLYQVVRLALGDHRYRLTGQPDPYIHSTTAEIYPVNTFAFWWADTRHPLLGARTREGVAVALSLLGLLALGGIFLMKSPARRDSPTPAIEALLAAERATGYVNRSRS